MKIKVRYVVNSIKIGKFQPLLLRYPEYDMTLLEDNVRILIVDKDGNRVYTSIMNAPWWEELEDSKPTKKKSNDPSKSKGNLKRVIQKKGTTTDLV